MEAEVDILYSWLGVIIVAACWLFFIRSSRNATAAQGQQVLAVLKEIRDRLPPPTTSERTDA